MSETFVAREKLPGQKGESVYPVRCSNVSCGVNKTSGYNAGGRRLLGHYYSGTKGQVQCPRCGHMNKFTVTEDGNVELENS